MKRSLILTERGASAVSHFYDAESRRTLCGVKVEGRLRTTSHRPKNLCKDCIEVREAMYPMARCFS